METPHSPGKPLADAGEGIADIVARERKRLFGFIRRRVADPGDAEDILQDVLHEFVRAWSLPEPIGQAGAWLVRVAQHRIVDRFRKKREEQLPLGDDGEDLYLDQALPAEDGGPEAAYVRRVLLDALATALRDLPDHERAVFVAHELEGLSFNELAARDGVNVNTLLGWKRRAVRRLRACLQPLYDELDW